MYYDQYEIIGRLVHTVCIQVAMGWCWSNCIKRETCGAPDKYAGFFRAVKEGGENESTVEKKP